MAEGRPLARLLDDVSALDPGRPALVLPEGVVTYAELEAAVRRCTAGLVSHGVGPGWRVPLVDDASLLSVATLLAAPRVGAACALMNPRLTTAELADLCRAAATSAVGVAGVAHVAALMEAGVAEVLGAGDLLSSTVEASTRSDEPAADADAVVLFTSGTTGTPKAVPLTNGILASRVAAFSPTVDPVALVSLMSVPLVHIGGMLGLLVAFGRGGTVVVLARFDAGEWLALAERHRVNSSFVVPTMLHRILEHPDFDRTDLGALVALTYGAAPAAPDLVRRAIDRLPGVALMNTFGQTETLGSITTLLPGDLTAERINSVGRALPGVDLAVVDPDSGQPVAEGSVGELWVRTEASVIPSTQPVDPVLGEGWLRTGDMVSQDADGFLYPAGRLADTINRGGEKFAPMEVEVAVRTHEAVVDVAALGVPDAEMGSRVGVAVVTREPLTLEDVRAACRGRIAAFKLPERLLVLDELPYNDFGKVDRKVLRALFAETAGDTGP